METQIPIDSSKTHDMAMAQRYWNRDNSLFCIFFGDDYKQSMTKCPDCLVDHWDWSSSCLWIIGMIIWARNLKLHQRLELGKNNNGFSKHLRILCDGSWYSNGIDLADWSRGHDLAARSFCRMHAIWFLVSIPKILVTDHRTMTWNHQPYL